MPSEHGSRSSITSDLDTVEIECKGGTVTLMEPDWSDAFGIADVIFDMIGDVRGLFEGDDEDAEPSITSAWAQGLETVQAAFKNPGKYQSHIARLFGILSDRDGQWFMQPGNVGLLDFAKLIKGALSVVPFASFKEVFSEIAETWRESFATGTGRSADSLPSSADGDLPMSVGSDAGGQTVSAETFKSELGDD